MPECISDRLVVPHVQLEFAGWRKKAFRQPSNSNWAFALKSRTGVGSAMLQPPPPPPKSLYAGLGRSSSAERIDRASSTRSVDPLLGRVCLELAAGYTSRVTRRAHVARPAFLVLCFVLRGVGPSAVVLQGR